MKKWEYKVHYSHSNTDWHNFIDNNNNKEYSIHSLGLDGWELVSVHNGTLYFKRELINKI